jgi:hypothetical protein
MKNIRFIVVVLFSIISFAQTKATFTIENNSNLDRTEAIVVLPWTDVLTKYPTIDTTNFVVINLNTKKQIQIQLEHKGKKKIQNILAQINIKGNSKLTLCVQKGRLETFPVKTFARYVPERKDDFAWENDRIAFRAYGKALEKTKEDAYGYDVWVKRTNKMVLNERYKLGKYHVDNGNGMDYYHVGLSLGAGNMAPYVNDTIRYSGNYREWKVLDNGPLRSTFQLTYDTWNAGGLKIKAIKTISIDAGSQLSRIENLYTFDNDKPLAVVIGIVKRPESGVISLQEEEGISGYWEPTHGADGTTGVGVILNTPTTTSITKSQILTKTEIKNNEPLVYYTGAAWDKAGQLTTSKKWFDYLNTFSQELKKPLTISLK